VSVIQFELILIETDLCPDVREAPALPPEEEVKMHRKYHYALCPSDIGNPALRIPYLHSLFAPGGAHLQDF
jgi:hypothetical protein